MASPTVENYLKALYMLADDSDQISSSDLGTFLKVSIPTVNSMVKKLHEKGLIVYKKYQPILLTSLGKSEAAKIIRKHRLTEMYLVKQMGFGWEEVHEIAEQMEHINAPIFFDRMDEILGSPETDPHGSPIPDREGQLTYRAYRKLGECAEGEKVILSALGHSSAEFLTYLNEKEIQLGQEIQILRREPFDGNTTIRYENHPAETLSAIVTDILLVESL